MATPMVLVYLTEQNTQVDKVPRLYNIEVEVNLSDIWEEIMPDNSIYVQVYLQIPIIINNQLMEVNVSIMENYSMISIRDKKVQLYGYYEGEYDNSRPINAVAKVWSYDMIPYNEGG